MKIYIILFTCFACLHTISTLPLKRPVKELKKINAFINKYIGDAATEEQTIIFLRIFNDFEKLVRETSHNPGSRLTSRGRRLRRNPDGPLTEIIVKINKARGRKIIENKFGIGEPETDQQSKWNDCVFQFLITQTYSGSQAKAECTKLYPPNT